MSLACFFITYLSLKQVIFGAWYNYFGSKKIGQRFNLHHEAQYRNYNFGGDLEQLLLRAGIGYNLTPNNNNLLIGYGFIHSDFYIGISDLKIDFDEHRIFQQFSTKQNFGRVYLQHRFRLEERFVDGNDVTYRGRYFLGLNVALNNKTIKEKTFYLSAYNEIFLNRTVHNLVIGPEKVLITFGRNRAYAGLGYCLNQKLKFELAYMNQYAGSFNQRDKSTWFVSSISSISHFIGYDFSVQ